MNTFSNFHKAFFVFTLVALAAVQTSCGFHLRGVLNLSNHITPIFLDLSSSDDELGRELQILLSASSANNLTTKSTEAKTVLKISSVKKKQRVVSVDNLGRAREYELNYKFNYVLEKSFESSMPSVIIKTNTVKLKRDLLFDPASVLAVGHEKESLYEDMRKDAAQLVLRQLSVVKQSALPKK